VGRDKLPSPLDFYCPLLGRPEMIAHHGAPEDHGISPPLGPLWVKLRNTRAEHMSSGMAPIADMREPRRHFRDVPTTDSRAGNKKDHLRGKMRRLC